jgi:hypothetical protein
MEEQTIWLAPRATAFTEVCDACVEEHGDEWQLSTISGALRLDRDHGWATCSRGHTLRVQRMGLGMPAGALR